MARRIAMPVCDNTHRPGVARASPHTRLHNPRTAVNLWSAVLHAGPSPSGCLAFDSGAGL